MPAIVSELEQKRDKHHFESLGDVELVYAMLGLNAEMGDAPNWGVTPEARYIRRMMFTEIAARWIPPEVFGDAFSKLTE
jgi:hypothetical protein